MSLEELLAGGVKRSARRRFDCQCGVPPAERIPGGSRKPLCRRCSAMRYSGRLGRWLPRRSAGGLLLAVCQCDEEAWPAMIAGSAQGRRGKLAR
jgi:hypothetical protein